MPTRLAIPLLIIVILGVGAFLGLQVRRARIAPAADTTPVLFADKLTLIQARDAAKARGIPVLVYATTSTCQPSRLLERTALADPVLLAWVKEHMVPVLLPIDLVQGSDSAFGIRITPTILIVKGGRETGRIEGPLDAATLLERLQALNLAAEPAAVSEGEQSGS